MRFRVTVARFDEVVHKSAEDEYWATSIHIDEDGSIKIVTEAGDKHFGAGTWVNVNIKRKPAG